MQKIVIIFETTKIKRTFIQNKNALLLFSLHFPSYFTDFAGFFLCFPYLPVHVVTPSGVEPSHANRGEWCAAAILTDCQQLKNKNTQMMIMIAPAEGVDPSQGRAGRGIGCYLSSDNSRCPYISLSCRSRKKVVAHSLFSSSLNVRICSSRDMLSSSYANVPFLMP